MKNLFNILLILFSALMFSQKKEADTAQVIIPNRTNTAAALQKPYVIMISADGFRYDYAKKYNAINLLKLSGNGVAAKAMVPSFPSITFPNHWSLITGLYPSHHGLVDNFFYDYKRKDFYAMSQADKAEDGSWYGGTPLWALAEKQGVLSASMHWVGSASDAGGARPTYYYHYFEKFSPEEKVDRVVNWLKLPEEKRPHFITLYFPEVDSNGHHFGPESEQTKNSVLLVDAAVGSLVKKVNALGLKNVNFIFVSDHGMLDVENEHPLEIPAMLLNKDRFDIYNSQTLLRVVVKNPAEVMSVYKELRKNQTADYKVVLDKRLKRKLYYAKRDDRYNRIGDILLIPNAPKIFLEKGKTTSDGKHGYNPFTTPEMKASFYAWGPLFKQNITVPEFRNVNVYPLVAEILGLKITEPIDGKLNVLKNTLKTQ